MTFPQIMRAYCPTCKLLDAPGDELCMKCGTRLARSSASNIVAFRGEFTNIKAMLHHIAADDDVEAFCIVVFKKDGTAVPAHLNCKRRDMAFAAAILAHNSLEGDYD